MTAPPTTPRGLHVDIEARAGDFLLHTSFEAGDELVVLYGHSGAGKTLTLSTIAGLTRPHRGRIDLAGRTLFDATSGVDLPPRDRRVGYVVQVPALFPHLDVRRNVLIGVERSPEAQARFEALSALLGIEDLAARRPHELSGGQQQRVALARALVRPTDVLLLDEPFSALDESLRADLRSELLRIRREYGVPIVFVTHDLREAHLLADRVAVLDRGRVLQFAPRDEVFRHPASRRVAALTGTHNLFEGHIEGDRVLVAGLPLRFEGASSPGGDVDVAIRAERCNLRRFDPEGDLPENCFVASITAELAFGNTHTLTLEPEGPGPAIEVEVASRPYEVLGIRERRRWVVELPAADLHVMPRMPVEPPAGL
ncbi:MAG: ABC transporter ATP-binding protein [Dehalococcoidia bacterium]